MKSTAKFFTFAIAAVILPVAISLFSVGFFGEKALFPTQAFIIVAVAFFLYNFQKRINKADDRFLKELEDKNTTEEIKSLLKKAASDKQKKYALKKLYSIENVDTKKDYYLDEFKKLISSTEDLSYYFARKIENSRDEERKKFKESRNFFAGRFKNKRSVYPVYSENVKIAAKRTAVFFVRLVIYKINPNPFKAFESTASFSFESVIFFTAVAILLNTVIRIVRSGRSYRYKERFK